MRPVRYVSQDRRLAVPCADSAPLNCWQTPPLMQETQGQGHRMDHLEQLQRWGAAHGAARDAERHAAQAGGRIELKREAQRLRERADRLHAEIYGQLGRGAGREGPSERP